MSLFIFVIFVVGFYFGAMTVGMFQKVRLTWFGSKAEKDYAKRHTEKVEQYIGFGYSPYEAKEKAGDAMRAEAKKAEKELADAEKSL